MTEQYFAPPQLPLRRSHLAWNFSSLGWPTLLLIVGMTACTRNSEPRKTVPVSAMEPIPGVASETNMGKADNFTYNSKTPVKILLEKASDLDLVDSTYSKIRKRHRTRGDAAQYTPEEKVIVLVWHSSGIIDNGGFEYLFSTDFDYDPDFRITAEAYRTLGLVRGFEAFQQAFKLFPNGDVPHEAEERIRQYTVADESIRLEINKKHWQDGWDKLREQLLAKYIRDNLAKLGDLDSAK